MVSTNEGIHGARMRILIATNHLCNFAGSELVSVELAEHYASLGHEVMLYAREIGEPLLSTIKKTWRIIVTDEEPEDYTAFDIIWSHHNMVLKKYNRRNKKPHQLIIANHMSCIAENGLERPKYDAEDVDMIFANSWETAWSLPTPHKAKAQLFQNPSPACTVEIFSSHKDKPVAASVSNHRPVDLVFFMFDSSKEVSFQLYGKNTKNYMRLGPDELKAGAYDFVICNGKTVQYAMAAGLPVFLFDSFGGCGWLTRDNFEKASWHNFSGRGFELWQPEKFNEIFDFEKQQSLELGDELWRYRLDLWINRMGLF